MPLYEYLCIACGKLTEKRQKFSDPEITDCPRCGGKLERTITAPAVQFKGGGWYADGYGSKKPAAAGGVGDGGSGAGGSPGESGRSEGGKSEGGKADGSPSAESKGTSAGSSNDSGSRGAESSKTPAASAPAPKPAAGSAN